MTIGFPYNNDQTYEIDIAVDISVHQEQMASAKQSLKEHHQEVCLHALQITDFDGNPVLKPHTSIFCPDCGKRIEAPGKTKPFQLRPEQR